MLIQVSLWSDVTSADCFNCRDHHLRPWVNKLKIKKEEEEEKKNSSKKWLVLQDVIKARLTVCYGQWMLED